jgi:WD40 repeat protein
LQSAPQASELAARIALQGSWGHVSGPVMDEASTPPRGDAPPKGRIFISYSRHDTDFADRIEAALTADGFEALIDRTDIYAFEDWWRRIESLIVKADTVVFVLSPEAVASPVCRREIEFAASLNKRFAPIVCRPVDSHAVPDALARLNFISFADPAHFDDASARLVEALRTDIEWVRRHTEFGEMARRWDAANRSGSLLLRGPVLEDAEQWIAARPPDAPAPTELTRAFIAASRNGARRRRRALTGSLAAGLMIALALAFAAYWQREIAVGQRRIADEQRGIAETQRDVALTTQSRFLTSASTARRAQGDPSRAIALALEALPADFAKPDRPYLPEAEFALRQAFRDVQGLQLREVAQHQFAEKLDGAALSPDGDMFAIVSGSRISIRDRQDNKLIDTLPDHPGNVWAMRFLPKGHQVIAASASTLRVYDIRGRKIVFSQTAEAGKQVCGWQYSPGADAQKVFNVGIGDAGAEVGLSTMNMLNREFDQQMVVGSGVCSLWPANQPTGFESLLYSDMLLSASRTQSALINKTNQMFVVDSTGGFRFAPGGDKFWRASMSHDGQQIAAASEGKLTIFDTRNVVPLAQKPLPAGRPSGINFSKDGLLLLVASADNAVRIWVRESIGELAALDESAFASRRSRATRPACTDTGTIEFATPSGSRQVSVENGRAALAHTQGGAQTRSVVLSETGARDAAFSPDGRLVLVATEGSAQPASRKVLTFDADSGKLLTEQPVSLSGAARCLRVSPAHSRIAAVDGTRISLGDLASGKLVREIVLPENARQQHLNATFTPDGSRLALHGSNGTLTLLDSTTGQTVDEATWTQIAATDASLLAFDRAGERLMVGAGTAFFAWSAFPSAQRVIESARNVLTSCIAPAERPNFSLSDEPPEWCVAMGKPPYNTDAWKQWAEAKRRKAEPGLAEAATARTR